MTQARKTYDRIAPLYDILDGPYEKVWKSAARRKVFAGLRGRILDAGAGTGCNFSAYPPGCEATACDASAAMLARADMRARRMRLNVALRQTDLTALDLPSAHFDAYVATFVFACLDEGQLLPALREAGRVTRRAGEIRIVDYCMSQRPLTRFGMRVMAPWLKFTFAATYQPATEDYFDAAGLEKIEERLIFGDVLKMTRLRPRS
ncbi:MAG: class I SAM-dependent methyltransferase [Hyphomicrobiales bacterium]|nr:class I SAM-dependent methyltransferase [Hyphomicrobiales bacterium]